MNTDNPNSDLKAKKILSIFLSYGHKDSAKVELIKNGLAERGYKNLWMDVDKIVPGGVWRRDIIDGITGSDVFIAFLSEYSMRDPGVCRDEIQISVGLKGGNIKTILLEDQEKVLPPATIAHTQWLDLSDWDGNEGKLPDILDDICKMIESRENFYFEDEVDMLRRIMNPVNCDSRIKELNSRQLFGRAWLYDVLKKWDESNKSNIFWLSGGAGFGKSMFSANLCFKMPEKVVAAHFVEWNNPEKNNAGNILKSLAFQLARRYPDYRKYIMAIPEGAKRKLFAEACEPNVLCDTLFCENAGICIDGGHESAWALIDALDEATQNGKNPVAAMIAQYRDRFPKWLKFVITSRDDAAVRTALGSMNPDVYSLDEEIKRYQRQDMRAFLHAALAERHFSEDVYDILIKKSEDMFLYLRYVCEKILAEKLDAGQIADLPQGITGIYESYFERFFGKENYGIYDRTVRPILNIYSAACEALPLDFFAEIMDCGKDDVRKAIARLGTLKTDHMENNREFFQLCHKSVWDWLVTLPAGDHSFRVSKEDGLKKLTDFCLNKIKDYKMEQIDKDPNCEYPLRYVISHLVEEKKEQAVWELLGGTDPQLPKLQFDYFGSYAASVSSLKTAILYYLASYNNATAATKALILPKLARLMITYTHLLSEQQKDLAQIFHQGNSLQSTLEFMDSIKDVKVYFIIGCYLLTKARENHWYMDRLISAIEEKCANQIDSITWKEIDFLGHGVLPQVAKDMTAEQMFRLLKNIENRSDTKLSLTSLKDHLNLPQVARAYWYFDKLGDSEHGSLGDHAKLTEEKDRIGKIQDAKNRCKELIGLATSLYVHDDLPEAERLLGEAVKLLKEADSKFHLQDAAKLYWNMGKTIEAGRLILDHHEIYGTVEDEFINDLFKFGLSKEACGFFEKFILPNPEEATDFLEKCVSPVLFLKAMIENGLSEKIKDLPDGIDIGTSDFIDLLETMIRCGAMNDAAENLKKFCSLEENQDDFFDHPKLLVLMRKLKEAGAWTENIPEERELKENYLKSHSLEKVDDWKGVFSSDFSPGFQLELIQESFKCFLDTVDKPDLSAEDKASIARDMASLLDKNSSALRGELTSVVCRYLDKFKELSDDNAFFIESRYYAEGWLNGSDPLLNDTLDKTAVDEFAAWCEQKVMDAIQNGNYDRDFERYAQALLRYYFNNGQRSKAEALLNILPKSDSEKMGFAFDTLNDILSFWTTRSEREKLPLPPIPENFTTAVDLACSFCSPQNLKLADINGKISHFFEYLKPYREQPEAIQIDEQIWKMLDPIFRKTPFNSLNDAFEVLKEGSWCIPEGQFGRWFGKVTDYMIKRENEDRWMHIRKDHAEIMISRFRDSENLPENWYGKILDEIEKITNLSDKNNLQTKLLAAVIRKGTAEQQQDILARLTDSALIRNSSKLCDLDLATLYRALTGGNVSDTAISSVVKDMRWEKLPFEKLCLIAPHMLDEKDYLEKWFDRLFRKLQEEKNLETMLKIAAECPELGLSDFCSQPETPKAGAPLTAAQVAGMVPKTAEAILSLRKQLADEELTPKGYAKRVGELLAPLPEETKQKYAELERSLNEGDITEKGFVKQLSELFQ